MKIIYWIGIIVVGLLLLGLIGIAITPTKEVQNKSTSSEVKVVENEDKPVVIQENRNQTFQEIKIANWNLKIFGDTKASKPELMNFYANTIDDYDIVFVQEIRDIDGSAFNSLCSKLQNYDCKVSSRAGRSSSKEQYGVIYKKGISIKEFKDFNPDSQDRWERPPIEVNFDISGYDLSVYNIHIKPDDATKEITNLEGVVSDNGNVIVIGDLNADCSYYKNVGKDFVSWNWLIKDSDDTTVSQTDCAYDRIIVNSEAFEEYEDSGIYTSGINEDVSDHYLVWAELKV